MSRRHYGSVSVDVDVDIDEVFNSLDRFDREDLYNKLEEEFGKKSDTPFKDANGYYDEELQKVLVEIWQNRNYLTVDQRARLTNLSKESFF